MKVIHIISGDIWGGAESVVFNLMLEISKRKNITPYVLLFNHGALEQRLIAIGINVHVIEEQKHTQLSLLYLSYQYIADLRPHIIHTHKHKENVIGSLISMKLNTPSLRTVHGDLETNITIMSGIKYLYLLMDRITGRFAQKKIVSVSNQLTNKLKLKYPYKKIVTISNGIQLPCIRNTLPATHAYNNIALIARCVPVKRIDIFLQTAHELIKSGDTQYKFHIIGDGPLLNSLKDLSKKLQIEPFIYFTGHVGDINNYLKEIDLVLITSDHEGLPMNLLEAISMRIPIISHNVGDIAEVLCYGKCGILMNSQDPKEYAEAIKLLLSDKNLIKNYTETAYENIINKYSVSSMADKYISTYEEILKLSH